MDSNVDEVYTNRVLACLRFKYLINPKVLHESRRRMHGYATPFSVMQFILMNVNQY
jgi:hypothetical protein